MAKRATYEVRRLSAALAFWGCGYATAAAQENWVLNANDDGVFSVAPPGASLAVQNGSGLVYGAVARGESPSITLIQAAEAADLGYNRFAAVQIGGDAAKAAILQTGAFNRTILLQVSPQNAPFVSQQGAVSNIALLSLTGADANLTSASDAELQALVRGYLFAPETAQVAPELGADLLIGFARRLTQDEAPDQADASRRFRLRGGAYVGGLERDARLGAVGHSATLSGADIGLEYAPHPAVRLGALVGVSQASGAYDLGLGDVDAASLQAGLSAKAKIESLELAAGVAYGRQSYDVSRPGLGRGVAADPKGRALAATASAAWLHDFGGFEAGPAAAIDFVEAKVDGYAETGDPFSRQIVDQRKSRRLDGRIGVVAAIGGPAASNSIRLRFGAFYAHELDGDDAGIQTSRFDVFPDAEIVTPLGASERGGRLALDAQVRLQPTSRLELGGGLAAEFGAGGHELGANLFAKLSF